MSSLEKPQPGWGFRPFNRHGLILTIAGIAYILTGWTYILSPLTESRKEALAVALSYYPIGVWGMLFVFVGFMAVISSRWPRVSKSWGYAAMTGLSAGWSATYAAGVMFEDAPRGNLTAVLQWGLLAFLWWAIPGLVSPDKTVVVVVRDEGKRRSD
jgi:hypothetical protein